MKQITIPLPIIKRILFIITHKHHNKWAIPDIDLKFREMTLELGNISIFLESDNPFFRE